VGDAEQIGSLVRQLLRRRDLARGRLQERVRKTVARMVGPSAAEQVRVRDLRGGVLRLKTTSSALAEELGVYRAHEIRAALAAETPAISVSSVRFEIE
jgi:Dna[CI] antecedent DciA-like protein